MKRLSTYIDYLPSVLWSEESDPEEFLGQMLQIFEKILTGIEKDRNDNLVLKEDDLKYVSFDKDNVVLKKGDREYASFEKILDNLSQIFDPWKTPSETLPWLGEDPSKFLDWLASWVSLELDKDWSEYQKRKFISEIVSIYQLRGTKKGLLAYLNLYATKARPRIVIDEGEAIFRAKFLDNGQAELYAVAHTQTVGDVTALLHPVAIAVDSNRNYIVVDRGSSIESLQPTIWKLSKTWNIDYDINNRPKPFYSGTELQDPVAIVVDSSNQYNVIDRGDLSPNPAIYQFSPGISIVISQSTTPKLPVIYPVDMVIDKDGKFIILDRGKIPTDDPPQGTASPKIVIVEKTPTSPLPFKLTEIPLTKVVEPTALIIDSDGNYLVADAKEPQQVSGVQSDRPAEIIRVDPNTSPATETILEFADKINPLIFPTSMVLESSSSLLVCDSGVRWGYEGEDRTYRFMAEPPAIYRVELLTNPHTIVKISNKNGLVYPTRIIFDHLGGILVLDRGDSLSPRNGIQREWRSKAHEFGVSILYSQQRPIDLELRNKTVYGLSKIIEYQKPAHSSWVLKTY